MRPQPIDETFNESYATKGLQPQGLIPEVANDNEPSKFANDNDVVTNSNQDTYQLPIRSVSYGGNPNTAKKYVRSGQKILNEKRNPKAIQNTALKTAAKAKIVGTNTGIYSWAFPAWFFIQLPLALLALAFVGLAAIAEDLVGSRQDGSITLLGLAVNFFGGILSFVDSIAGTSLAEITDPTAYATTFTSIVFILAMLKLLVIGLIYQLSFVNSVFGRGAGIKIPVLIIVICGYFFPLLNLFPWFFLWTAAVAIYPR